MIFNCNSGQITSDDVKDFEEFIQEYQIDTDDEGNPITKEIPYVKILDDVDNLIHFGYTCGMKGTKEEYPILIYYKNYSSPSSIRISPSRIFEINSDYWKNSNSEIDKDTINQIKLNINYVLVPKNIKFIVDYANYIY